ncbi:MAG TPA: T9SS type A sorting domain-containing protein [Bacteroidales bacterium]|nr:T9SS type A sorting domain-containing protein [Bacteroidales bacterium]
MKSLLLTVWLGLMLTELSGQENIQWISHFGSTGEYYGVESGRHIITDSGGNIYVSGEFADSFQIDGLKIKSNGDKEIFLVKLNPSGKVQWIKNFGGKQGDWSGGICTDKSQNLFLTGNFRDTLKIEDSVFTSNPGNYDIFLVKLDTSGQILWSQAFTGEGQNATNAIASDSAGNIYITGYYLEDLKFGRFLLEGPSARSDLFIVKLNTDGEVIWAKSAKGNANNYGNDIACYDSENLYLTGFMWDSVYFDSHLLTSSGNLQAFISKIDATTGEFLWAVGGGGIGLSDGKAIAVDSEGDVIMCGWYRKAVSFNNDSVTNGGNYNGPDDVFIAKFNSDGSLIWLKSTTCSLYSDCFDLSINNENDIYITGNFRGVIKWGSTFYYSTVPFYHDIFVFKMDPDGNFEWFKSYGGDSPMNDIGFGLTCYENNLYITGMYSSNSWFDNVHLECDGASDIFVLNLSDEPAAPVSIEKHEQEVLIYPNPFKNSISLKFLDFRSGEIDRLWITDMFGKIAYEKVRLQENEPVNISGLKSGLYILHIQKGIEIISEKIVRE